jgi:hypothetical protein
LRLRPGWEKVEVIRFQKVLEQADYIGSVVLDQISWVKMRLVQMESRCSGIPSNEVKKAKRDGITFSQLVR